MATNVHPMGDPAMHFWLTRSVARVMGVNLSDAMAGGQLSAQDYARMVTQCRRCPHVTACQEWLATEAVTRSSAMAGCLNRRALEQLQ